MSLYRMIVNRFVIPVIEAHKAEGRAEGLEQGLERGLELGLERGIEQTRAEWQAWNERRLSAEREGREFGEPPPGG